MDEIENDLTQITPVIMLSDDRRKRKQEMEEEEDQIRKRIRESQASPEAVLLPADPQPTINDERPMRVAAYTRVSTSSIDQVSSIEYQQKWYKETISKKSNWELSAIYSDEGKSGTSMKKRPEFRRMLQDAKDGAFDLIICASVSRFARNISDCIEQTDLLKIQDPTHPVGVYFESENIYTLNDNSNQAFQMHSMLADWESATKSRRMILSYDQRITLGQYPVVDLLGYRHTKDGQLIIHPEEAITIKYVFYARLLGHTYEEIANVLTEKGRPNMAGDTNWTGQRVANIMKNERRWGYLIARKIIVIDYKKGKTARNTYIRDGVEHHIRCGAVVKDHHEGIVSPEVAKAVQMVKNSAFGGGISDLFVIKSGALKGFVNVAPGWNAVDDQAFVDACRCAYAEDEYEELQKEATVTRGDNHSKVVTMDFHDYEVPHSAFFISKTTANITLSENRISFSRKMIDRFGASSHVEILYHPILRLLAFRSCSCSAPNAIPLATVNGTPVLNISAPGLCRSIYEHMKWVESFQFRMRGVYRERNGFEIMLFYLDETQIIPDKETKARYENKYGKGKTHYIPYRYSELAEEDEPADNPWGYGIPVSLRKRRDALIDSIKGSDIQEPGTVVPNTTIGDIPTREEALEELERLLSCM